jgi:hypothetical protein
MKSDRPLNEIKFFIGPMSKNVVDSVIEFSNKYGNKIGFIPSRRQLDYSGGYVNNWCTENFCNYVRKNNSNILICRDHGGENQGQKIDDGMQSFIVDCQHLDLIHVDPFRVSEDIKQAAEKTKTIIQKLFKINPTVMYEVGTEEAIFKYSPEDLKWFLDYLKNGLTINQFNQIKYAVVQSGTGLNLSTRTNTGKFNKTKLKSFIDVVKKFNLMSKEHNGDYLIDSFDIETRFELGLDAINIAPEFGQIESEYYLEACKKDKTLFDTLYKICYNSGKWKKWIRDIEIIRKDQLIMTCCHYVLSDKEFLENIKSKFPESDKMICEKINTKLRFLYEQTKSYCI